MITAVIADDEPLLLHHLNKLLGEAWPQLNVVAKASDGKIAFDAILEQEPDVVFLDIRMPNLDGITLAKKSVSLIRFPILYLRPPMMSMRFRRLNTAQSTTS